jgi:FAD binding domain
VQFLPCGKHPDYRSNMPGAAVAGRAIVPEPFDGRLLGAEFTRIRPPIPEFMLFGGIMVGKADIGPLIGRFDSIANFIYSAKLFARYLTDRLTYRRGTRLMMGNALIGRLFYSLRKRKVPILFDAPIVQIIGDRRRVTGARLKLDDREMSVTARRGVVLATGGYGHNKHFREAFMPQPVPAYSMSSESNSGDGVDLGQRLGAAVGPERSTSGLWTPVSIVSRRDGSKGLFPHLVLDRAKPGLIAVDSAGRRFVNEAISYHDFVLAMYENNKTTPSIPAWLICDTTFLRKYGLGIVYPGHRNPGKFVDSGYLVSAPTVEELAGKIGANPTQLGSTIARYNVSRRPVLISILERERPSSTASMATPPTSPILASGRWPHRRSMRSQSGPRTSQSVQGLQLMLMHVCSTMMERLFPAFMPVGMTWLR